MHEKSRANVIIPGKKWDNRGTSSCLPAATPYTWSLSSQSHFLFLMQLLIWKKREIGWISPHIPSRTSIPEISGDSHSRRNLSPIASTVPWSNGKCDSFNTKSKPGGPWSLSGPWSALLEGCVIGLSAAWESRWEPQGMSTTTGWH